ncbi:MAG: hypothetical protein JXR52_07160 [Bacteroidales bacterium]|nr:hypothetical protein [Bacteroidales bacterium]MBN2698589.1 hypothetical protein [Bacteroidales bacterium]
MEIKRIYSNNFRLYNPVTKEIIIDDGCNDDAKSLVGYWHTAFFEEPVLNGDALKSAWEEWVSRIEEEEESKVGFDDLDKFLEAYDHPGWKAYVIESSGIACGPVYDTLWMVVDKDVIFEDTEPEDEDL